MSLHSTPSHNAPSDQSEKQWRFHVHRAPYRLSLSDVASGDAALQEARQCFAGGEHLRGIDIYEQLSQVFVDQQVPILAELYDHYMQLGNRKNRYTLYVSRHYDFKIQPGDAVLDIGSGHDPFPLATHLADIAPEDDTFGRAGVPLTRVEGLPFTACSVEDMPFNDKQFDFVYCSHVLEHTKDPEAACRELSRVARRGYVETPTRSKDVWLNSARVSNHFWSVESFRNGLEFRAYTELEIDGLQSDILMQMHCSPTSDREKAFAALVWLKAPVVNTHLYWEDELPCLVR